MSAAVTFDRMVVVEARIRERGWSLKTVDGLAKELGVDRSTIYNYKNRLRRWTQRTMQPGDQEGWRAQQMQLLLDAIRGAMEAGDFKAVASLVKVHADIVGTTAAKNVNVNVSGGVTVSPAAIGAVVDMDRGDRQRLLPENLAPIEAEFVEKGEEVAVNADSPPR